MMRSYIAPTRTVLFGKPVEAGTIHQMSAEDANMLESIGLLVEVDPSTGQTMTAEQKNARDEPINPRPKRRPRKNTEADSGSGGGGEGGGGDEDSGDEDSGDEDSGDEDSGEGGGESQTADPGQQAGGESPDDAQS